MAIAFVGAILLALAGCGSGGRPTPSPTKGFSFEVASQYTLDAHLDGVPGEHSERIIVTLGKPVSLKAYRANPKNSLFCNGMLATDTIVPISVGVVNTSKTAAAGVLIGYSMAIALDFSKVEYSFGISIQDTDYQQCDSLIPLEGATPKAAGEAPNLRTYQDVWSPPKELVQPGGSMQGPGLIALAAGENNPALPPEAVFLRMAPTDSKAHVHYTVTAFGAVNGQGGVITEGADTGVYYLPLGNTSPCGTFAGTVKMKCGAKLP
jgi:hypothetical protein